MPSECSTAHLHRPPPTLPALLLLRFCVGHLSGRVADRWSDLEVGDDDEKEVEDEEVDEKEVNEEEEEELEELEELEEGGDPAQLVRASLHLRLSRIRNLRNLRATSAPRVRWSASASFCHAFKASTA